MLRFPCRRSDHFTRTALLLALASAPTALMGQSLPDADLVAHGLSTESIASLRADLEQWCAGPDVSGFRILLLHRGEVVLRGEFGRAPEPGPLVADSSSLPILGLGVLIAVDHGLLDLAQPVSFYLPALTGTPHGGTTVHELLRHKNGAAAGRRRAPRGDTTPSRSPKSDDAPIRSEVLLPAILESAAGIAADRWLADRVLNPCGLRDTSLIEADRGTTTAPLAETLRLQTTLDDLARFTLLHGRATPLPGLRAEYFARLRGEVREEPGAGAERRERSRAIGYYRERVDASGTPSSIATLGVGTAHCWSDLDLELVGVVQFARTPRSPQFLARLRERTRGILGDTVSPTTIDWSRTGQDTTEVRESDSRFGSELHRVETRIHLPTDRSASALVILLPDAPHEAVASELADHLASHGHAAATVLVTPNPLQRKWLRRQLHAAGSAPPELTIEKRAALHQRGAELRAVDRVDVLLDRAVVVRNAIRSLRNERRIPREPAIAVLGFGIEVRTALLLGGAELVTASRAHSAPEPAVRAILAIAPPSPAVMDLSLQGLAQLGAALYVATRADAIEESVGGLGLAPRALFDLSPSVQKFLVTAIAGSAFEAATDSPRPLVAGCSPRFDEEEQLTAERDLLFGTVTAFVESTLRATESAERWLETSIVAQPRRIARIR